MPSLGGAFRNSRRVCSARLNRRHSWLSTGTHCLVSATIYHGAAYVTYGRTIRLTRVVPSRGAKVPDVVETLGRPQEELALPPYLFSVVWMFHQSKRSTMSTLRRLLFRPTGALFLLASAWSFHAGCGKREPCCTAPFTNTNVSFTWTIDGALPAAGCAAVGATTVRLEILGPRVNPSVDVTCASGVASVPSAVFLPSTDGSPAGAVVARLLNSGGVEVSARRQQLAWYSQSVSALLPMVTAPPGGGTVRYRWCEPLSAGSSLRIQGDGPMLVESVAGAPLSEIVIGPLASGQYTFREVTAAGLPGIGPADATVTVTDGQESLIRVYPCPSL